MANSNAVLGKIEHSAKVELDSYERNVYKTNKKSSVWLFALDVHQDIR